MILQEMSRFPSLDAMGIRGQGITGESLRGKKHRCIAVVNQVDFLETESETGIESKVEEEHTELRSGQWGC